MSEPTRKMVWKMWLSIVIAIALVIFGVFFVFKIAQDFDPQYEPPPIADRRPVDAGALDDCPLRTDRVGETVEVLRYPGRGEMVVGTLDDDVVLDVVSVRVDFVEIRGPIAGWVERRYTRRVCPDTPEAP